MNLHGSLSFVDREIWSVTRPFRVFGLHLGARMTVIRLADGGLLLHSPVRLDDDIRSAIDSLGPVRWIVAPSKVHHLFVSDCVAAYPRASLFGAPGLSRKRADLRIHAELGRRAPRSWPREVEYVLYEGSDLMNEVVLLHRLTGTLVLTDLAFNIRETGSWWTRRYLEWSRAYGRFGQSKVVKLSTRDRVAGRRSVDRILDLDFDRVTMAHGDILEHGGRAAVREVFEWL